MFLSLAVLFALEIIGGPLANSPPDVKDFTPVLSKELEFRIDDCKTAFVGRMVVYRNPDDPYEFVKVYYRQVAIVSERACENNSTEKGNLDRISSNLNYHQKEEADILDRVQKATDAFAYVQWRITKDLRTGQDIQDGSFQSWLLEQNGNWTFSNSYNLDTSPFSELSKGNPKKITMVGIRFSLAGGVHIVRVDQDEIQNLKKEATNEKK